MSYTVGSKAQPPTGLERLLTIIEESEGERVCNSTYSTAPSSPVDRLTETIEPLPLEESITALLDEALGYV